MSKLIGVRMVGGLFKSRAPQEEEIIEAQIRREVQPRLKLKLMVVERHADLEKVLSHFRKGDSVIVLKISPLRDKDMGELRKVVDRLKTHCSVTGSDLAALDDNWLVLVPPVVEIAR